MRKRNLTKITPSTLFRARNVHFIGIGGIGISAIARMFLYTEPSRGVVPVKVSGSDVAESEVMEGLRKVGAKIFIGQRAENVPKDCDLVIYTIAVAPDNPEFAKAKKRGILMMSYPEALGEISRGKFTIAVSGTHGKTTTTAMLAKILMDAGLDPTVIVGSFLWDVNPSTGSGRRTNFVSGRSKYLVVEGCEYRRSFLHLSPKILVITNIDADHLDYYKDLDDIESAFRELAAKVPEDGAVICDFSDARAKRAAKAGKGRVIDFGKRIAKVPALLVPGIHNKKDAAAALTVAEFLGVDEAVAESAVGEFTGTWRRFEYRGKIKNGTRVYDDYGHHPTEISATLAGARELFPKEKIIVIFQPHLYSRTKDHLVGFGKCFKNANEVILLPIYSAREKDPGDINSKMVMAEVNKNGQPAYLVSTFEKAAKKSAELAGAAGVIITMGAGETNKVADLLVSKT
ncbi:MAG TPA: Mur ligase domain-containing protein [Candidatus Paceibacterota bacterium]